MYNKVISGVYKIVNRQNGDFYIGSSSNLYNRIHVHQSLLKRNKHNNPHLQRAWNKFQADLFDFIIILICEKTDARFYEQQLLDKLHPKYNLSPKATGGSGIVSDKMRSAARTVGLSQKGKKKPESYSKKLSERMIGNKLGLGRKMSPENKEKLREINLGNKYFLGKTHTEEYKKRMSSLLTGRVFSEETRRKMSESAKLRRARQKSIGGVANYV